MKPAEFLNYYNTYCAFNPNDYLRVAIRIFGGEPSESFEDEHSILQNFYYPFFLFDTFTRSHIGYDKASKKSLMYLSKDKPTNGKWTLGIEIEKLVGILLGVFGPDMDGLGPFNPEKESISENWNGRKWELETAFIRLAFPNGWVQLYFDLKSQWPGNEVE